MWLGGNHLLRSRVKRILHVTSHCLEELRSRRSVDRPVIAAHGDAHALPNFQGAIHDDRFFLNAANGENPRFRRVDDRGELVDAEHAEVRYGECCAGILLGQELALTCPLGEIARLPGNVPERQTIGVEQYRCDETVFHGDGHRDVDAIELTDLVVEPVRVDLGVLRQGERDGFDHDVVERHLVLIAHLGELRAHFGGTSGVELGGQEKCGDGPVRFREPPRDRFSDLSERDVLEVALGRESIGRSGSSSAAGCLGVLDVALDDAATWSGALNSAELDSFLGRQSARERRCALTPIRGRRRA